MQLDPNVRSRTASDTNSPAPVPASAVSSRARPTASSEFCNDRPRLSARSARLTGIELDILTLLGRGLTNQEIAVGLEMNVSTVRWRLNQMFLKLDARNRIEALARARELLTLPSTGTALPRYRTPERLGKTQVAILSLLKQGMTNQEIANDLSMTIGTTKWHLNQIFGKLQVRNRVEAAMSLNLSDATQ
jgi:DNA-binding NarL/FixJ family response regulator